MQHLQAYQARRTLALPTVTENKWTLKRYAIVAENRAIDNVTLTAALESAIARLPEPGSLDNASGNHGVGFQIVHFAEVAVVSPVFYWMWGSVLANIDQMRAPWDKLSEFQTGVREVLGCVWEMEIVTFETQSWMNTLLGEHGTAEEKLSLYLDRVLPAAEGVDG